MTIESKKQINPLLLPIDLDLESIRKRVLTNIAKMLRYRGLLDKKRWNEGHIAKFVQRRADNNTYKFPLDNHFPKEKDFDHKHVVVKIVAQKINSISSSPIVNDFLKNFTDNYKILVFDSISDKALAAFSANDRIEVFTEKFLMLDLLSLDSSPDYEVLTPEETKQVKNSYNMDNKTIPKMQYIDAARRYLNLKKGQVVRIIRNSERTGRSIGYRRVK